MQMPELRPIPIPTKGKNIFGRIFTWVFSVRKWEVLEDWPYQLRDKTTIIIPKGFEFDGASIPRPLWAILSPVGLLLIPGLIHDYGYRYNKLLTEDKNGQKVPYKENAGKAYWDKVFRQTGIDVNGVVIIDTIAWLALAVGGWYTWWKYRRNDDD